MVAKQLRLKTDFTANVPGSTQKDVSLWKNKIESCNLIHALAESLQTVPDLLIGFSQDVSEFLDDLTTDRVLQVQQAARRARSKWSEFEIIYNAIEEKKEIFDADLEGLTPDEILHIRTGLESTDQEQVNQLVQEKVRTMYQRSPEREDEDSDQNVKRISFGMSQELYELPKRSDLKHIHDVDESNWYDKTRSANFLKKKEGIGGGHMPGTTKLKQKAMKTYIDRPVVIKYSQHRMHEQQDYY